MLHNIRIEIFFEYTKKKFLSDISVSRNESLLLKENITFFLRYKIISAFTLQKLYLFKLLYTKLFRKSSPCE